VLSLSVVFLLQKQLCVSLSGGNWTEQGLITVKGGKSKQKRKTLLRPALTNRKVKRMQEVAATLFSTSHNLYQIECS
jgi:hypothetical protein